VPSCHDHRVKLWKWLGLAGLAGVAATGVVIARDQRQRAQLTPDDVRARLHERLERGADTDDDTDDDTVD
jgi:hypothetical protein